MAFNIFLINIVNCKLHIYILKFTYLGMPNSFISIIIKLRFGNFPEVQISA